MSVCFFEWTIPEHWPAANQTPNTNSARHLFINIKKIILIYQFCGCNFKYIFHFQSTMYSASILLQMLSPPTLDRVALFVVKTHQRQVDWLLYDSAGTFLSALALPLSSFAPQLSNSRRRVCRHHSKRCSYSGSRRLQNLDLESSSVLQLPIYTVVQKEELRLFSNMYLFVSLILDFCILQMYRLLSTVCQQNLFRGIYSHVAAVSVKTGRCQFHAVLAQSMSDQTRSFSDFKSS